MTNRKFKATNILWLALALLLHSALLLVPSNKPQKLVRTQESIAVVLDIQPAAEPPLDQPVRNQPAHNQEPEIQPVPPELQVLRQLKPKPLPAKISTTAITTTQLLLDVSKFKFPEKQSDQKRQLGTFEPLPLPANWLPSLKLEDNLFNSTTVAAHTKIVDQWKSFDGRQNYVVKTSTGKTLCGHASPRNRISSPEEPVIMWRVFCD